MASRVPIAVLPKMLPWHVSEMAATAIRYLSQSVLHGNVSATLRTCDNQCIATIRKLKGPQRPVAVRGL